MPGTCSDHPSKPSCTRAPDSTSPATCASSARSSANRLDCSAPRAWPWRCYKRLSAVTTPDLEPTHRLPTVGDTPEVDEPQLDIEERRGGGGLGGLLARLLLLVLIATCGVVAAALLLTPPRESILI